MKMKAYIGSSGGILRDAAYDYAHILLKNWRALLLLAMFATGVACGASVLRSAAGEVLQAQAEEYFAAMAASSVLSNMVRTFALYLTVLALCFFAGQCAVGLPLLCAAPCGVGLITGVMCGSLYNAFGLKGLGYSVLSGLIPNTFLAFAVILACNEGIMMSADLLRTLRTGAAMRRREDTRLFYLRFLLYFSIVVASCTVKALLNRAFCTLLNG